jgi:hypothetical protein
MWKDLQYEKWVDRGQWDTDQDKENKRLEREKTLKMWGKVNG